ncbi:hypothetical protein B296_00049321 [Ensete ventricosum]|uniref:Uncharacterized protein n=1 Tax=Ensete ventricosum TaxID=4639 RepID=A0A426YCR8_ENSVE|nr:hypothetical protein B296_00049321 [Ensete ventricosum]
MTHLLSAYVAGRERAELIPSPIPSIRRLRSSHIHRTRSFIYPTTRIAPKLPPGVGKHGDPEAARVPSTQTRVHPYSVCNEG